MSSPDELLQLLKNQMECIVAYIDAQTRIYNEFCENHSTRDSILEWQCTVMAWQQLYDRLRKTVPPLVVQAAWKDHLDRTERVVHEVYVPFSTTGIPLVPIDARRHALALNVLQASTQQMQQLLQSYAGDSTDYAE